MGETKPEVIYRRDLDHCYLSSKLIEKDRTLVQWVRQAMSPPKAGQSAEFRQICSSKHCVSYDFGHLGTLPHGECLRPPLRL